MTYWRTYRITSIGTTTSSYIRFNLDSSVSYSGGSSSNHIYCVNQSPFNGWCAGDYIEIDNHKTCYQSTGHDFTSTTQVKLTNCHHGCGHSHAEYEDLKTRYSALERERNDLRGELDGLRDERDEWIRKYDELRKQSSDELNAEKLRNANTIANERSSRQNTEFTLRNENAMQNKNLENAGKEITSLKKQIEDSKSELSLVRTQKDNQLIQKSNELKEVEKSLSNLRIDYEKDKTEKETEINKKDSELQRKEEQIDNLLSQKEFSQEELLIEKLRSERQNLELFAEELKVDLEKTESLIRDHDQLFQVKKTRNRTDINTYESNITQTKKNLRNSGVSIISIQEICRKCEKIAELNWELNQVQEQYQAQQEIPTNN